MPNRIIMVFATLFALTLLAACRASVPAETLEPRPPTAVGAFGGAYLGHPGPGLAAEPFAPEIFGVDGRYGLHLHSSLYFSPDGDEILFTDQSAETWQVVPMRLRQEGGIWGRPEAAPFPALPGVMSTAILSPDWSRLYLYVDGPLPGEETSNGEVIGLWSTLRTDDGWSEVGRIERASDPDSELGSLYVSASLEGGFGATDIYRIHCENGVLSEPENLGPMINTAAEEQVSCVAPDESFLIFYRFDPGDKAAAGLYATQRRGDNRWSEPLYLDKSLRLANGFHATLSSDGRYLFLLDRGIGIFWVSSEVIERLAADS
jgi:hypothetical protein